MRKLIFLVPVVAILVVVIIFSSIIRNQPQVIETEVFIYGGSLGGSSAAIQLSNLKTGFVLIEESNWLGGQASSQGVSTFDQNGRKFQESSVYSQIIAAAKTADGGYLGNATTGPGMPAKLVNDTILKLISPDTGKIFTGSKLTKINKPGEEIESVEFIDKDGKTYLVKAKVFMDASDYSDLARMSGEDLDFGIDLPSDEYGSFTETERGLFINGDEQKELSGFGNRIQPFTATMAIIDNVFTGYSFQPDANAVCMGEPCHQFEKDNTLTITPPHSGSYEILALFAKSPEVKFSVDGKDLPFGKSTIGDYTLFRSSIDFKNQTPIKLTVNNQGSAPAEFFGSYLNESSRGQSSLATFDAIKSNAQLIADDKDAKATGKWTNSTSLKPFIGNGYSLSSEKGAKISFEINPKSLNETDVYYVLLSYSANENRGSSKVSIIDNNKEISSTLLNQQVSILPGVAPIAKLRFEPEKTYTVVVENSGTGIVSADAILITKESGIGSFKLVEFAKPYTITSDGLYDVYFVNNSASEIKLSLNGNSLDTNNTKTPDKGTFHLKRAFFAKGDMLEAEINGKGFAFIKMLNLNHYAPYIFKDFNQDRTYKLNYLTQGFYDVYVTSGAQSNKNIELKVKSGDIELLNSNSELGKGISRVGTIRSNGHKEVSITLDCSECKPEIYFTEPIPAGFDPLNSNSEFINYSDFKKLLSEKDANGLFRFRQILDAKNISADTLSLLGIKDSLVNKQLSLGVTYLNIPQNDYAARFELPRFAIDSKFRDEIYEKAEQLSYRLYYWLKYESPATSWGCSQSQAVLCSALRINWLPDAMGSQDGFSQIPYLRETPRVNSSVRLNLNSISLLNNICKPNETACTDFVFGKEKLRVRQEFLNTYATKPVAVFYYPTDIHKLTNSAEQSQLDKFNQLLSESSRKNYAQQFYFWKGIFEQEIKPGSIELEQLASTKATNLLFCSKNISVSQILNGSTRLHPAESAIGQACGTISAFQINNSLTNRTLLEASNYQKLYDYLVTSGQYLVPLDDVQILLNYSNGQRTTNAAIFRSVTDGIIIPDINQNPNTAFLVYQFLPERPINKEEYNRFARKFGFKLLNITLSDRITLGMMEDIAGTSRYNKIEEALLNTYCFGEKQPDFCKTKTIPEIKILSRQDLAVIYSTLSQE